MKIQNKKLDFTNQKIFVAADVHKKSWRVSIYTEQFEHKTFTQPPEPKVLVNYLIRNFPNGIYHFVYEAGFCGFWIYEVMKNMGINAIVVNPADVPTKDKERRNKSDKIDSRKLARSLRSGELTGIYVPSRQVQEDRSLLRVRQTLVRNQTRCKNQIKAFLSFFGINISMETTDEKNHWSKRFIEGLENLQFKNPSAKYALNAYIEQLKDTRKNIAILTKQIRDLARENRYRENVQLLTSIHGIGTLTAMIFLVELDDINRFKNLKQLASFVGLIPGEKSSGDKKNTTDITKRSNKYLRYLLIESAWIAVRKDPVLMQAYNEHIKKMGSQRAIIKIALRQLNRIRYVLKNKKPYIENIQ